MALPIPSIFDHALASVDLETQDTLGLFEALVVRLEPAHKRELRFRNDVALEFPQIIASYLLTSLQRIRVTSWGVITSVNAPNEALFVMAIRAMLESTANVCYLRANLQKANAGDITRKELTYLALRMKFATRKPDDFEYTSEEAAKVSSVNVLTAMKAFARYAVTNCEFMSEKVITAWYERLCEFCHPNALANSAGSNLVFAEGLETFEIEPAIRPAVLMQFATYAYVTLYVFCRVYNEIWETLMNAGEALPSWEPPDDPRIQLG